MRNILQTILPFEIPQSFADSEMRQAFSEWEQPARQVQISAIMLLTALLYIVFTFLDKSWASESVQVLMRNTHLFVVVPILLTMSFLAYKKHHYILVIRLLTLFPLISMSCHVYIASQLQNNTLFLTEGYLGVLWIFIVSGLTFKNALISASIASTILIVSGKFFIENPDTYTLHLFWIFCSFSFGFMGALISDRSRKVIFLNQQDFQKLAITDSLTGIYNRNKFDQLMNLKLSGNTGSQKPFALLIIDIDHFKQINDSHGHNFGDTILQQVADALSHSIRSNDSLIRWGGEEFVVVTQQIEKENLIQFCEKLRTVIENNDFHKSKKITISIGGTLVKPGDTADSLINRADAALYKAKENGRNLSIIQL